MKCLRIIAAYLTMGYAGLAQAADEVRLSDQLIINYSAAALRETIGGGQANVTRVILRQSDDTLVSFHSLKAAVAAYESNRDSYASICGSTVMKGIQVQNGEERAFQIQDSRVADELEKAGLKSGSTCPERPGFLGVSCIATDCNWHGQGSTSGQCGPGLSIDSDGFWPLEVICMCTPGLPKLPKMPVPKINGFSLQD